MKIAIVSPSPDPPVFGGGERLWRGLISAFEHEGIHEAESVTVPVRERTLPEIMDAYRGFSELDLSGFDLVISTKYPAWMAQHDNHVVYMQHPLRGLYDTYHVFGLPQSVSFQEEKLAALQRLLLEVPERGKLPELFARFDEALMDLGADHEAFAFPGPLARRLVHFMDRAALAPSEIRRYLAISNTVAGRRGYFPRDVPVTVVHHPSDLEGFRDGELEYLFTASRLDSPKRVHLLIEAMQHVGAQIPFKIAGTGPEMERLKDLAGPDQRIEFLGFVSDDELLRFYADALAVAFVPEDEDMGLIQIEAMNSGKTVITTSDSGGPTEQIMHGVNGLVVLPHAADLARAISRLAANPQEAREMGNAGRKLAAGITWPKVLTALTTTARRGGASHRNFQKPKLVVVSTFPLTPPTGGGQLRCLHLYGQLTSHFDVHAVSLAPRGGGISHRELADGFTETSISKTTEHVVVEKEMANEAGVPLEDILAPSLIHLTPSYEEALAPALEGAAGVILAHPYLFPTVKRIRPDVPFIYDAHNAELRLKKALLPPSDVGEMLRDSVREIEGGAVREAVLIPVTSKQDWQSLVEEFGADQKKRIDAPNGVDTRKIPYVSKQERARNKEHWLHRFAGNGSGKTPTHLSIFFGSWHLPNLDAAEHILDIASELPHVLFLLVGGHTGNFVARRTPPNVRLLGVVSDMTKLSLLKSVDLGLNPMARGSGTNLKIVEYFAAGIPVVSTAIGVRGLDAVAGEHLEVASLDEFPDRIRSLLDNGTHATTLATKARALVEEKYDWSVVGERFLNGVLATL